MYEEEHEEAGEEGQKVEEKKEEEEGEEKEKEEKIWRSAGKMDCLAVSSKISSARVCNHHELLGPLMEHTYIGIMKCKPYKVS